MQSLRVILLSVLLASALIVGQNAYAESPSDIPTSLDPAPRLKAYSWMQLSRWYQMHTNDIKVAEAGEARVLFIGDSITEGWELKGKTIWKNEFMPLGAANFGIGGDMTQNLIWRLDHGAVGGLDPEAVVLLIGTNNLSFTQDSPVQIAAGARAVVEQILEVFPNAEVLVYGVFPRGEAPETQIRQRVEGINAALAELDAHPRVSFRDIASDLTEPNGRLSKEVAPDFLHLSEEGYRRWAVSVVAWLEQIDVRTD